MLSNSYYASLDHKLSLRVSVLILSSPSDDIVFLCLSTLILPELRKTGLSIFNLYHIHNRLP